MNLLGTWLWPAALVSLLAASCGEEREAPGGNGGQGSASAGGALGNGSAGQNGVTLAAAGKGAGGAAGSASGCEPSCAVAGGATSTSAGASGGGPAGSGGAVGSAGAAGTGRDAGSGAEPAQVYYLTRGVSLDDASQYTIGPMDVPSPSPDRSLFVVVQSASNVVTAAQRVLVNGVEATKLVAVGEDVQPSAPSALFLVPFPAGLQATVEVEMSASVVRCAVSLVVAYGLQNTAGVDDSETLAMKTSGTMTVDVVEGGSVITALAMAVSDSYATAELPGFQGTGFEEILSEGTPTLLLVGVSGSHAAGPEAVNIAASDATYNFRSLVAAVH